MVATDARRKEVYWAGYAVTHERGRRGVTEPAGALARHLPDEVRPGPGRRTRATALPGRARRSTAYPWTCRRRGWPTRRALARGRGRGAGERAAVPAPPRRRAASRSASAVKPAGGCAAGDALADIPPLLPLEAELFADDAVDGADVLGRARPADRARLRRRGGDGVGRGYAGWTTPARRPTCRPMAVAPGARGRGLGDAAAGGAARGGAAAR